jgi:hypothetical protein
VVAHGSEILVAEASLFQLDLDGPQGANGKHSLRECGGTAGKQVEIIRTPMPSVEARQSGAADEDTVSQPLREDMPQGQQQRRRQDTAR